MSDFSQAPPPSRPDDGMGKLLIILGVVITAVVGLIFLVVGIAWFAMNRLSHDSEVYNASFVEPLSVTPARWEQIRAASSEKPVEVDQSTLTSLELLLARLFNASLNERNRVMYRCIDADGFIGQMNRSRIFSVNFLAADSIRKDLSHSTPGPNGYDNFKIFAVKQLGENGDELLVYAHAWDEPIANNEVLTMRYWVVNRNDKWYVSDWEDVGAGLSHASEYAAINASRRGAAYVEMSERCVEVIEQQTEDYSKAVRLAERIREKDFGEHLTDRATYNRGFAWELLGEHRKAIKIYASAADPSNQPLILLRQAACHIWLDENEEALELLDQYESIVGQVPASMDHRVTVLSAMGRYKEAFESSRKLADMIDEPDFLEGALRNCANENAADLAEMIGRRKDPAATAMRYLQRLHASARFPMAESLASLVQEHGNEQQSQQAQARLALLSGDEDLYFEKLLAGLESAESKEEKIRIQSDVLSAYSGKEELKDVLAKLPFPSEALTELAAINYDTGDYDDEKILEQLKEYSQRNPKDIDLQVAFLQHFSEFGEGPSVTKELQSRLKRAEEQSSEKLASAVRDSLFGRLVREKKFEEALKYADVDADTWSQMVWSVSSDDLNEITQLQQLYEKVILSKPQATNRDFVVKLEVWKLASEGDLVDALLVCADEIDKALKKNQWSGFEQEFRKLFGRLNPAQVGVFADQWGPFQRKQQRHVELGKSIGELVRSELESMITSQQYQRCEQIRRTLAKTNLLQKQGQKQWLDLLIAMEQRDASAAHAIAIKDPADDSIEDYELASTRERLADLLLEHGMTKEIGALAERWKGDCPELVRMLLAVKEKDTNEVERQLRKSRRYAYSMKESTFMPLASDPEFAEARSKWPLEVPGFSYTDTLLMYNEKPSIDVVQSVVQSLLPGESFINLDDGEEMQQRIIFSDTKRIYLVLRKGKVFVYGSGEDVIVPQHNWVLAIGCGESINRQIGLQSPKIVKLMIEESVVGIFDEESRKLISDPQAWSKTKQSDSDKFSRSKKYYSAYFVEADPKSMDYAGRLWANRRCIAAMVTDPESVQQYEALVDFSCGDTSEKVWLPVTKIDEMRSEVHLNRNREVKLFPYLPVGEPMRVDIYSLESLRKVGQASE